MATRKSPSRGTGSRPAKATAAIGKSRAAKKPLKVSAKPAAPEVESEAESNVVPMTAAEPAAEPAPVIEETVEAPAAPVEPPVVDDIAEVEASATEETPEIDEPAEDDMSTDETIEETKVEAAWPFGFSSASMFPGFPQMPQMPSFGDFSKFGMPNFGTPDFGAVDMNAFVTSSTALAEGMRSLGEEVMAFSQKSAQRNVETTMAVLGASSIEEAVDLQSRFVTGSVDEMMSESAKLTGMAIEVANKAAAPFTRF